MITFLDNPKPIINMDKTLLIHIFNSLNQSELNELIISIGLKPSNDRICNISMLVSDIAIEAVSKGRVIVEQTN